MIIDSDAKHFDFVADLADLTDIVNKSIRKFTDVTKSVTSRKNLDERAKIFHAADGTVVNLADLDRSSTSFDFFQRLLSHLCVCTSDCDFTVFFDFDNRLCRFLDRTNVLATRADQHSDLVRRNFCGQQTRSVRRDLFAWLTNGRQHRFEDVESRLFGLLQSFTNDLAVYAANFEIQLDTSNSVLRSSDFKVHIAEMVFATEDVGDQSVIVAFLHHTDRDTRNRILNFDTGRHQT